MKKNLNFLNKIFVIKKPYNKKNESQYVYFSNGYTMKWCHAGFCILNIELKVVMSEVFQFENGIANHSKLNDRVFLENAIKTKCNIEYADSLIKYHKNKRLIEEFITRSGYTYISPLECKRLDKNLLKIIEYQVNRLDKGEELITNDAEYLKLI